MALMTFHGTNAIALQTTVTIKILQTQVDGGTAFLSGDTLQLRLI
jgi:hypothetical protein